MPSQERRGCDGGMAEEGRVPGRMVLTKGGSPAPTWMCRFSYRWWSVWRNCDGSSPTATAAAAAVLPRQQRWLSLPRQRLRLAFRDSYGFPSATVAVAAVDPPMTTLPKLGARNVFFPQMVDRMAGCLSRPFPQPPLCFNRWLK